MRPIGVVLVPISGSKRDALALGTALDVARRFGAHVRAFFAHPDPAGAIPQVGVPFATDVIQSITEGLTVEASQAEELARDTFAKVAAGRRATITDHPRPGDAVTCSFRTVIGPLPEKFARAAELADLAVFPPLRPGVPVDVVEAFLEVLTHVGRPTIVASEAPQQTLGRSIVIAWNGSGSAARAVLAAIPILKHARNVLVVEIGESKAMGGPTDIEDYLSCHGITVARRLAQTAPSGIGDRLASMAKEAGADLLVMGGYGHSHLREILVGGVTAEILGRAELPVFFAH